MDATLRNMEKMKEASPPSSGKSKRKKNRLKTLDRLTKLEQAKKAAIEEDQEDDEEDTFDEPAIPEPEILVQQKKEQAARKKKKEEQKGAKRDDPLKVIPDEYRKHGFDTEPMLHYLTLQAEDEPSLAILLDAAQQDIRLHQARIKAAQQNDPSLLASYDFTEDPLWKDRQEKKKDRLSNMEELQKEAREILQNLKKETVEKNKSKEILTGTEQIQLKLARWQQALELYVYAPTEMDMDLLELLEKLLYGTREVR